MQAVHAGKPRDVFNLHCSSRNGIRIMDIVDKILVAVALVYVGYLIYMIGKNEKNE